MLYSEIAWVVIAAAVLLLALFCIIVLIRLRGVAKEAQSSLQILNERLPGILKNIEEITVDINTSTNAVRTQVQQYADTAARFHGMVDGTVRGLEWVAGLPMRTPLYGKISQLMPLLKGIRAFINVFASKLRG